MASGIKAPGRWIPGTVSGVVVDSKYVRGGYITVESLEERDALLRPGCEVVTPGTKIYVKDENIEYIYSEVIEGQGEFQDVTQNTLERVAAEGYVKDSQVETLVDKSIQDTVPKLVDAQLDTVKEEITKETLEQVGQQVEQDFVKNDVFNEAISPIQEDINSLQQESQDLTAKSEANAKNINSVSDQVSGLSENLSENYYTRDDTIMEVDAKLRGYTSTEDLNQRLAFKADLSDLAYSEF